MLVNPLPGVEMVVGVLDGVAVPLAVGVEVRVAVAVKVPVSVAVDVGVKEGDITTVWVGVGWKGEGIGLKGLVQARGNRTNPARR